jgi:hypothetical protein
MPDLTAKLGLELPKGNETVNREAYNRNITLIDQKAAAQSQVDEPFNLLNAVYDTVGNKIDITFGPGRVTFLDILVAKTGNSTYSIEAPQSNTSYYIYIKNDGSFTHNTTAENIAGAALIWKVATGSPVSYISIEDRRGRLSGTDAQAVIDYVNARITSSDPLGVPKPYFSNILPEFYLWCDGKTIGDGLSGATARANADVHDLFIALWSATGLKIYESTGALSARGASAEADWASHKRLELPKLNGRTLIGCDNLGDTPADVVRDANADVIGGTGGTEKHTLSVNELPSHNHTLKSATPSYNANMRHDSGDWTLANNARTDGNTTNSTGGGQAHNNMQPWIAANWIIRY